MNKLSIICPSYNSSDCIRTLIDSVLMQTCDNYELIVVDGGSKDGTVEILKEYGTQIKWISEKDQGIYDAMNKGINLASGEWLYFIGADDSLYNKNVLNIIQPLLNNSCEVLLCQIYSPSIGLSKSVMTSKIRWKNIINHQGAIYHKKVFEEYRYSLEYRISSDYELNLYVWNQGFNIKYSDIVFANHPFTGVSAQAKFSSYLEEIKIRNKYVKSRTIKTVGLIYSILRYVLRLTSTSVSKISKNKIILTR